MQCASCGNGERRLASKPKAAQRAGRVAVVTDVPVEECPSCGEIWLDEEVALHLDELFSDMLAAELVAVRPYSPATPTAA